MLIMVVNTLAFLVSLAGVVAAFISTIGEWVD